MDVTNPVLTAGRPHQAAAPAAEDRVTFGAVLVDVAGVEEVAA
ncbi:hypothetical protein H4W32_000222 [Actinophytocola algeriensis]|uniref:Uncharacterized protein n=1 Tax=Actinophytocola algeriensis TaxID=1768010 RepID=A0A7W7VDM1_9PSEU|nr:hypothetical protein [Actinophytocola algeriensis]MBE1472180.1 hypothetical protein [Actinophytocola algeriensis]